MRTSSSPTMLLVLNCGLFCPMKLKHEAILHKDLFLQYLFRVHLTQMFFSFRDCDSILLENFDHTRQKVGYLPDGTAMNKAGDSTIRQHCWDMEHGGRVHQRHIQDGPWADRYKWSYNRGAPTSVGPLDRHDTIFPHEVDT